MRQFGSHNQDVCLFPDRITEPDLYREHDSLVTMLHADVTTAVYKMNGITNGREHDKLVDAYYGVLDELQTRITNHGPYLMGESIRFADLVLFISLIRLDLAYQWRFGLGRRSVRENYPGLFGYMHRILHLPGMAETVLPRDIMALYFMTLKWVQPPAGRTLPQVPESWEDACGMGSTSTSRSYSD
jgi:glutathionyl-hydroquinone reductase